MKYTASDLADWFDAQAEEYWRQQDEWLIQAYNLGDADPVIVFADWYGNYVGTAPNRLIGATAGGIADVLRLGNDLTFDSAGGFAKGVVLNVLRLLTVLQPEAAGAKNEFRHQGLLALRNLKKVTGAKMPCQYNAINNIVSFLKNRKFQYFADIKDVIAVGGKSTSGMSIKALLEHPSIVRLMGQNGITWRALPNVSSIDELIAAARRCDGPVRFSFTWIKNGKQQAHAMVAIRDPRDTIRLIDYTDSATSAPGGLGYSSWEAMVEARTATWGPGLKEAKLKLSADSLPAEFTSTVLKVLSLADGTTTFGVAVAVGMKWVRDTFGGSFDDAAPAIAKSVNDYFEKKVGSGTGPGTPESLYPPPVRPPETVSVMYTHTIEGPGVKQSDWLSSIAKKWYGDMLLWPAIFDFNRSATFTNPNVVVVGQRIKVPFLNNATPAQLADYRKRGMNWRS